MSKRNIDKGEKKIFLKEALLDVISAEDTSRKIEYQFEETFLQLKVKGETEFTKLSGLRDHFRHKKYWSGFLMLVMLIMVLFQICLIIQVGKGKWSFEQYDWLLPTLMIQYLAQMVGLAFIVVKSLFKDLKL